MLIHYIKIAFRNLLKYKTQSIISGVSLAVGFTCFSLAALWIWYESTYDSFHREAGQIYFVGGQGLGSGVQFSHYTAYPLADHLKENFPEIQNVTRVSTTRFDRFKYNEVEYPVNALEIDSAFISMFDIKILEGNTTFLLPHSNEIAITSEAAKRIFGNEPAINKELKIGNETKIIGALVEAWEGHSNIPFDMLLNIIPNNRWGMNRYYTLIRTHNNIDLEMLNEKLKSIEVEQTYEIESKVHHYTRKESFQLVRLTDIRKAYPIKEINVGIKQIQIFAITGALIVLCGLFNYLTLFAIRIRLRAHEFALRKINGSSNTNLTTLLLTEFGLMMIASLLLGMLLIELSLPRFIELSQIRQSSYSVFGEVFIYYIGILLAAFLLSLAPIYYFRKQSLHSLISSKSVGHSNSLFRKVSLTVQLIVSIGFIFCTSIMIKQISYLHNSNSVGFERKNIGVVYANADYLADRIKEIPEVTQVMVAMEILVPKFYFATLKWDKWEGKQDDQKEMDFEDFKITPEFIDFYSLNVIEGTVDEHDDTKILINETARKLLNWHDPIGKKMGHGDLTVVGVIQDMYYASPLYPVQPAIYHIGEDKLRKNDDLTGIHFKFLEGRWDTCREAIKKIIKEDNPNNQVMIYNVEEIYNKYTESDVLLIKLLSIFTAVCILIAVFGIFSLITLSCEQRRKEIAIRKVNGASVWIILRLFAKEYLWLLLLAAPVAFSISYYIMKLWLENYMIQTQINFWNYAVVLIGLLLIILLSIGGRVWKAARQNPAEVIKSE